MFLLLFNSKKPTKRNIFRVILFLWIFSIGFVADLLWKIVEYPWHRIDEDDAPTADAIIVLSSGGRPKAPGVANIFE